VYQPTSPAQHDEDGFTLLEVVCVLAILAIIAAIIAPAFPRGTSGPRLQSYAVAIAALIKTDRTSAVRRKLLVATDLDITSRVISSGATNRIVRLPTDVAIDALLPERCNEARLRSAIQFFPSGMSCGAVITLSRLGSGYEIRVNWLTGGIEVVSFKHN
jgi:general secretion pathway protein H